MLCTGLASCGKSNKEKAAETQAAAETVDVSGVKLQKTPDFNGDSAYLLVKKQVDFGPRIPNKPAHKACAAWLSAKLKQYGSEVTVQDFTAKAFTGEMLDLHNIIGSYNPTASRRILLTAHWDTRPFADQDSHNPDKSFDGANDGGSGVAVLLEIARNLQQSKPTVGVDIILWDGEDFGENRDYMPDENEEPGKWWCLGSRYWSEHKHIPNYSAFFGINLDMVGGPNARFAKEGQSMQYAPTVTDRVWQYAHALGYSKAFPDNVVEGITDDHINVNRYAKINMIDIIEYENSDGNFFSPTWHTHNDDINHIDKNSMQAVGQTLLQTLWQQQPEINP